MQDRTFRLLDKKGRVQISRVYRGNQFDGEVELINCADGIRVIPFSGDGRGKVIRKFNSNDRLNIPTEMRRIFNMVEAVEVYREDDGSLIIRVPRDMCCICGSVENLHKFMEEKSICNACLKKIHNKLLGSTDE